MNPSRETEIALASVLRNIPSLHSHDLEIVLSAIDAVLNIRDFYNFNKISDN